jgi:hypothetical protein
MNKKRSYGVAISLFFVVSLVLLSGCTSDNSNNNSNGQSWVNTYTPAHSVGSGEDDFWTVFPDINPDAGKSVSHLSWVIDSLKENCVVFVVHKTGCVACQPQADRVLALGENYVDSLVAYDLDMTLGGDVEQKGYEAFLYDPVGPPGYIALTGIFTLVKDNGKVTYGWHSWEGDVADAEMETWIKDGIYYYTMNSEK